MPSTQLENLQPVQARAFAVLIALFALFLVLRLPVMYRQPGGQDEDCYAVPGLTILQAGIPRLPHIPARNPESVFYRADEAMYCEPPLYFYFQSLFYACLPHVYGTARLSAAVAGLFATALVFSLNRKTLGSDSAGLWGAGLFLFSRWFYFPATSARPDILCTAFGLAAIAFMFRWRESNQLKWLIAVGIAIGAGGLTHPFALVYAVQIAVWSILVSKGRRRITNPAILAGVSILVASLWIPLILMYPKAFEVQFKNQFLGGQSGNLLQRAIAPWESLWYHTFAQAGMIHHIEPWQTLLVAVPFVACMLWSFQHRSPILPICWLILSSVYLMSILVGPHHPVMGYWSYTAALMFVCTGRFVAALLQRIRGDQTTAALPRRLLAGGVSIGLILSMIPGSGLKTLYVHLKHWDDINYNAPLFGKTLALSLPADAICAVDTQYLLDFIVNDRKTLLAQTLPIYFRLEQHSFDFLLVSRSGMETAIANRLPVSLVRKEGVEQDPFACYCEIYQPEK